MEYYDLFMQGPSVYIPVLALSVLITVISYCAYPLLLARFRRKPITARKYRVFCYLFNIIVMVFFTALNGSSSGAPYVLWTSVFCHFGKKTLERRNLLVDPDNPVPFPYSAPSNTALEYPSKFQQPAVPPVPIKPKESKHRFCKHCGHPIDPATKKCTGCGKQYFRPPSLKKSSLVSKVVVILSVLIVGMCVYRNIQYQNQIKQLHAQIAEQSESITALRSNLESVKDELQSAKTDTSEIKDKYRAKFSEAYNLAEENEEMKDIFEYCKKHMVFVPDDNTRIYHRYSCLAFKFSDSLYGIYSADTARAKGFTRCPLCFN